MQPAITRASEQVAVDDLVRNADASTERTTVDVVLPTPVSSTAALPLPASAASLAASDLEDSDALFLELFGSSSSPSSVKPTWRRGAGAEVNNVAENNAGLPDTADGHRMEVGDGGAAEPQLSATDAV